MVVAEAGFTWILAVLLCLSITPVASADPPAAEASGDGTSAGPTEPRGDPSGRSPEEEPSRPEVAAADWNPLAPPLADVKARLAKLGISYQADLAFTYQFASEVLEGNSSFATLPWRLMGDWEAISNEVFGQTYLAWNFLGTVGLNYDPSEETLSYNVGSVSYPNTNVYPDAAAMNELYLAQVSASERFELLVGRIDMYYQFDLNRAANDGFGDFLSFALESNLSIPFPEYGGVGAIAYVELVEGLTLMLGVGDSSSDEPFEFWKTADDSSWWQIVELEWNTTIEVLGKGTYRLTPWHNHLFGEDGWGVALNIDQELGVPWLIAFLRAGAGDPNVTPIKRFVSGGLAVLGPLGRPGDQFGVGAAWSKPSSDFGFQNETLLEVYYRIALSPSIHLTPDLQLIFSPAENPEDDVVVVPGIRLVLRF